MKELNADNLGILASAICVAHCLALPGFAFALPVFGASMTGNEDVTHTVLALFVVAFCLFAIVPGYRQHRQPAVLVGMIAGLSLVLFATFAVEPLLGHAWEMPIITIGNFIVMSTHLRNRKLLSTRCC
jgi:uncharacterized YccA/Bax inhibitor family protein